MLHQFELDKIVHIRGVDHPESISIGPRGEAYTTGTGGQVYRINLADNVAVQFASTAPRRMLGQAVDADSRLYCADTTGKVIKPVFHYGFIPLIIYLGVKSEPSASFMQLLTL